MKFPALRSTQRNHLNHWLAVGGLLFLVLFHLAGLIPYQNALRTLAFDIYQNLDPRERVSAPVVIVDIDEKSLQEYGQWPWPRSLMARLVEAVNQMQPAAVGIDIIMPEADRASACQVTAYIPGIDASLVEEVCKLPSNDALLAAALADGRVAMGVAGIDQPGPIPEIITPVRAMGEDPMPYIRRFSSALKNLPELEQATQGHAILSTDMERGVVRRVPMVAGIGQHIFPALSLEVLRLAIGSPFFDVITTEKGIETVGIGELRIPTRSDGTLWVHYSPHDPRRFVSASSILNGELEPEFLERKLVLIGFTGLGLVDFPSTVLGERVPGVEIHAQVLESVFDNTVLQRPDWSLWLEGLLILLLGLLAIYGFPYVTALLQVPGLILITLGLGYGGLQAFSHGLWLIDVASPALLFLVLYSGMLADSLIREEAQVVSLQDDLKVEREAAAKVQGEMEAAKRFQMGIVPDARNVFAHEPRIDIAAMMEPAKMVGGDLYDCFMLDQHHVFFSLGDVCGKGVPASLFMVISKTLCKSVALRHDADFSDLGGLISQANLEICRDNPEMLFVTAFIGILDLRDGQLVYCNAGHERPQIFAADCHPRELTGASGPPIGVLEEFDYETFRYKMSPEEMLCIFSDGLTEAANIEQALYGQERLHQAVSDIDESWTCHQLMETAARSVHSYVGEAEPSDDLTLMVVRWCGSQTLPVQDP